MSLSGYFENSKGTGVLGTADSDGNVDLAIYARPHVTDENTVAFIMNERLSYENVTSNPKAAYLFLEDAPGYKGKRHPGFRCSSLHQGIEYFVQVRY